MGLRYMFLAPKIRGFIWRGGVLSYRSRIFACVVFFFATRATKRSGKRRIPVKKNKIESPGVWDPAAESKRWRFHVLELLLFARTPPLLQMQKLFHPVFSWAVFSPVKSRVAVVGSSYRGATSAVALAVTYKGRL